MPTFCRHNRLIQNCPICSREQHVEMRPVVSSAAPRTEVSRTRSSSGARARRAANESGGVRVQQLARSVDDGYRTPLAPGLRSSVDAERLAAELAFAATRLRVLAEQPPGLYAEVAGDGDLEQRAWLAFLIAFLCPLQGDDPFASIRAVVTPWASGEEPALDGVQTGPRTAYDPARGDVTIRAYRAWAERSGSQAAAFTGDHGWSAERRFARVYERLALPGLQRDARFDVLVTLGRLGVFELRADALMLGGPDEVTVAAKRALGIGDSILLERRSKALAEACELPLEALDLGFYNWSSDERVADGMPPGLEPDQSALDAARGALGV